jgi:hypothetical protein
VKKLSFILRTLAIDYSMIYTIGFGAVDLKVGRITPPFQKTI